MLPEKNKKSVIITSYLESYFDLNCHVNPEDYIICTDGGYNISLKYNITPDLIVGDFDSISGDIPKGIAVKKFPPEKDFTDLELAIQTARDLKFNQVEIFGGMGGRLDHTVANLQLMSRYGRFFDSLVMKDGMNKCFVVYGNSEKSYSVPAEADSYISLFSLSEQCTVTIANVKYPLTDHTLTRDFPLGVSNEFQEKSAALSVRNGTLLVVISRM